MNKTYSQIKNDLVGWSLLSFSDTLKYPVFFPKMQALAQAEVRNLMRNLLKVILGLCDSGVKVENKVTLAD